MREVEFRVWINESKVLREATKLESLQTVTKLEFDVDGHLNYLESWGDNTCQKYGFLTGSDDIELSQYTGLRGKNGKKIFEGDICWDEHNEAYGVVAFDEGTWICSSEYMWTDLWDAHGVLEVKGNKWQNPELLELKTITKDVLDSNGKVIECHDVCRDVVTNEILLIEEGVNKHHNTIGLVAVNKYVGIHDWLDVYPDGALIVLGNVDYTPNDNKERAE